MSLTIPLPNTSAATEANAIRETKALKSLLNHINDFKNLKDDWDGDGAVVISKPIVEASAQFLHSYFSYIINLFGTEIALPEPGACGNGTIDLEWHHHNTRLLINIRNDKDGAMKAFYYGDVNLKDYPIKGNVPVNQVTLHLAAWMKDFLQ